MMTRDLESAIMQLPPAEVAKLASWLVDYQAKLWDEQLEADLDSGRLDSLLAKVGREYQAGGLREL